MGLTWCCLIKAMNSTRYSVCIYILYLEILVQLKNRSADYHKFNTNPTRYKKCNEERGWKKTNAQKSSSLKRHFQCFFPYFPWMSKLDKNSNSKNIRKRDREGRKGRATEQLKLWSIMTKACTFYLWIAKCEMNGKKSNEKKKKKKQWKL